MTDEQKVQLLPCPFCGGTPLAGSSYDEDVLLHNIRCRCGAGVNDFFGQEEAIEAWNTRQAAVAWMSSGEAKPFAWLVRRVDGEYNAVSESYANQINNSFGGVAFPVYTHPPRAAEDARDAERYRWLRGNGNGPEAAFFGCCYSPEDFDNAIDQAIAGKRGG